MIRTQSLSYQHVGSSPLVFPDILVKDGHATLLLGDSGKGKTTLLHLLGGLLRPTTGTVSIDDTDIHQMSETELDLFRGRNIGIVFQQSHFIQSLTVLENLLTAQYLAGLKQHKEKAKFLLQKTGLTDKANRLTYQLSQGEQQRLAIVRALLNEPNVVLADEPTSALDDKNCENIIHLLESATQEAGATLLIVTHDKRLKEYFKEVVEL